METIIDANGDLSKHKIQRYAFKRLDMTDDTTHLHETTPNEVVSRAKSAPEYHSHGDDQSMSLLDLKEFKELSSSQSVMMRRLEELYTFVETMRGDLSQQSQRISAHFENNLQQTYQDALKLGEEENRRKSETEINDIKIRLMEAISIFSNETAKVQHILQNLEPELVKTAIDIAQEVIKIAIDEKSELIALALAKELTNDLKSASDIKIKVNPMEFDFISNNINKDKIKVESDVAVARGGVIVLSNLGNIDGTIKERFAKVKATFYENMTEE